MEEYIYAALTLHASGTKINEENVKKVLQATGKTPDETRIKNLIASLEGINIDEALKKAVVTLGLRRRPTFLLMRARSSDRVTLGSRL